MNLAMMAYGAAALGFLALNLLLLIGRRGDPFGYRLSVASALSSIWAGTAAISAVTRLATRSQSWTLLRSLATQDGSFC